MWKSLAVYLLLAPLALAAPAPFLAKKEQPKKVLTIKPGNYIMTWRGVESQAHFHSMGFFSCHWQGRWWNGQWIVENEILKVVEHPLDEPQTFSKWSVKLTSPTSGELLNGSSEWLLKPMK